MHSARIFLEVFSAPASLVTMATLNNAKIWMNVHQNNTNAVPMQIAVMQLAFTTVNARKAFQGMAITVKT